jgi:Zn-dependent protease
MSSTGVLRNPHVDKLSWADSFAPQAPWLQLLLLALTLVSTTAVGSRYMYNFELGNAPLADLTDLFPFAWVWQHPEYIQSGLPFSITLLAILLAHEFSHYIACRAYGVRTSLPFVFPAPTLGGTAGALLRIQSRIPSRSALITIGASGPIAGFLVALVTTCYGLVHSKAVLAPTPPSLFRFQAPELITLLHRLLSDSHPELPPLAQIVPHPVLVASWIGILITALNLIPAGQLDGGHILYALSPRLHKLGTNLSIGVLLYLGTVEWVGWLLWAFLLMSPSMAHHPRLGSDPEPHPEPPPETSAEPAARASEASEGSAATLPPSRRLHTLVALFCGGILLLCGTLQPCVGNSLTDLLQCVRWGLGY